MEIFVVAFVMAAVLFPIGYGLYRFALYCFGNTESVAIRTILAVCINAPVINVAAGDGGVFIALVPSPLGFAILLTDFNDTNLFLFVVPMVASFIGIFLFNAMTIDSAFKGDNDYVN